VKLGSLEWTGTDDSRLEWDLCLRFGIGVIALVCTLQSVILMDPTCRGRPRIALADLMLFVIHSISATKLTWDPLLKVGGFTVDSFALSRLRIPYKLLTGWRRTSSIREVRSRWYICILLGWTIRMPSQ
jgi:hypothetical protein